ncbi:MAG: HipA domain-containing protein [Chlorobi bacterium]|nr:MAG: putative DNA-binding transcriptional regulator [Chlorobi bacterium OLB7]MBK8911157.1 HipA domain-containing protein [Chlorobiota bacterium]
MNKRCLGCYLPLESGQEEYHPACSRALFHEPLPPQLPYDESDLLGLGRQVIQHRIGLTGVQPKLSADLQFSGRATIPSRMTIVGVWGGFILKPPTPQYSHLPELEDLTMHLASIAGIRTVPHGLLRMASGSLCYVTRRIDRNGKQGGKLHLEDMCQITGRLTEHKYRGSYEQIGRAIQKHSATPGLDLVNFCELMLFVLLTGNADMHLKNVSLIRQPGIGNILSPAYDLVATAIVMPSDTEEIALTLNGKKRRITRGDVDAFFHHLTIRPQQANQIYTTFAGALPRWEECIQRSFVPAAMQTELIELIQERAHRFGIGK